MGRRALTTGPAPAPLLQDAALLPVRLTAPTIAEQVYRGLVAREDERCLRVEAETGVREERRRIRVPLVRIGPRALCQNIDYLQMVTKFDYDLNDVRFQEYCQRRAALQIAGHPGTRRWMYFADCRLAKADYLADPYWQEAEESHGKRHRFSPDEMDSGWTVIQVGRAAFQDCWELYQIQEKSTMGRPPQPELGDYVVSTGGVGTRLSPDPKGVVLYDVSIHGELGQGKTFPDGEPRALDWACREARRTGHQAWRVTPSGALEPIDCDAVRGSA